MGDDSGISWGADGDTQGNDKTHGNFQKVHSRDQRHRQEGTSESREDLIRKRVPGPGDEPDDPAGEDRSCAACEEEHRQEIEALQAEVKEWKQRAEEHEIKAALQERHLNEVKHDRAVMRQAIEALHADREQAKRPWWKRMFKRT